jgi:CheY-like chemotaxis protein
LNENPAAGLFFYLTWNKMQVLIKLVIEDNKLVHAALSALLLLCGHRVSTAKNSEESIVMTDEWQSVAVWICDIVMPELSGPSQLLALKKRFLHHIRKVILMSPPKSAGDFLQKHDTPHGVHMTKPINFTPHRNVLATLAEGKISGL